MLTILDDLINKSDCNEIDKAKKPYILEWCKNNLPEALEYI